MSRDIRKGVCSCREHDCSERDPDSARQTALDREIYLGVRKDPPGESAFAAYSHPVTLGH